MLAPQVLHAGPDGIQRMADAVSLGADPLRFAVAIPVTSGRIPCVSLEDEAYEPERPIDAASGRPGQPATGRAPEFRERSVPEPPECPGRSAESGSEQVA